MKNTKIKLLLVAFVIIGWYGINARMAEAPDPPKPQIDVQAASISLTPREFLKAEIKRQGLTNRDEIILSEVIQAESNWNQFWPNGEVKVSNGNIGLAQINHGAHEAEYTKLGLDPYNEFDNLRYAIILYKREGIRPWKQWSGHNFIPALAKKGIFFNLEERIGQVGGQCVLFIQNLFQNYEQFGGRAIDIVSNIDMPAVGEIVLTTESETGHVALIYKIENDELILAESNYGNDEKITVGRRLKIGDPVIRGYFDFR